MATGGGRLNLLVTDGETVAAATYGDTLYTRRDGEGVLVGSETYDDQPGWEPAPDRRLVVARASDVRQGLSATPKWLPPERFYDTAGSALFEQITRLPEYHPSRREPEVLRARVGHRRAVPRSHPRRARVRLGREDPASPRLSAFQASTSLREGHAPAIADHTARCVAREDSPLGSLEVPTLDKCVSED